MGRRGQVALFSGLVAATALGLQRSVVEGLPGAGAHVPPGWFVGLVVAFAAAELVAVSVRVGDDAYAFSLMELPLIVAMYFLPPDLVVPARLLGSAAALAYQRLELQKAAFNLAMFGLDTATAVVVWHAVLGSSDPLGPRGWLATVLAALTTSFLGSALVACAIRIATGERERTPIREMVVVGPLGDVSNACFALISVYILTEDWRAGWLLVVVAGVLLAAYRGYDGSRRRTEALQQMNRLTALVARMSEVDELAQVSLEELRRSFRAEAAELYVDVDGRARGWTCTPEETVATEAPLARTMEPLLVDESVTVAGAEGPLRMAVRIRGEGRDLGVLALTAPASDDLSGPAAEHQLRALARHLGLALDNLLRAEELLRRSEEREWRALHDELTELPNRRLLGHMISESTAAAPGAVLVVELHGFRAISHTLGYAVGDRLLFLVGERLQALFRDRWVGRVGSDQFAVVLPHCDPAGARATASYLQEEMARHFELDGIPVAVGVTIGIAVAGVGEDAAVVLHHADLAAADASTRRTGIEVYRDELERQDASRLGLLADLRAAIAADALEVWFQPKFSVATGGVLGAEALVRWQHPDHGPVAPDEFVPLAEQSSLITPLTLLVLRHALHEVQGWRRHDPSLTVAVNISPRSLLDEGFVDAVARTLALVDVPPSAVTLEITEDSLMTEPEGALVALERLRALGVLLSVDDLGTGYSSLAYLQRLPVDEVKLDRSFLADPGDHTAHAVIETIVALAHRLGREVVAEGVEHPGTMSLLHDLGCDVAQGYALSRPLPAPRAAAFMAARSAERADAELALRLVR